MMVIGVNLEHIKAIVSVSEVLVLNCRDPVVWSVIQDLGLKLKEDLEGPAPLSGAGPVSAPDSSKKIYSATTSKFMVEALKCVISLLFRSQIWKNDGVTEDNKAEEFLSRKR